MRAHLDGHLEDLDPGRMNRGRGDPLEIMRQKLCVKKLCVRREIMRQRAPG